MINFERCESAHRFFVSDDTVISYESGKRIRYEVDDTTGSGSRDRNLIAVDTVLVSYPNYYLAHSLKTELRENGNLVMTYSVYDEKLENHRLVAAGYYKIPLKTVQNQSRISNRYNI